MKIQLAQSGNRSAFTLVELMIAIVASSFLMVGLASSIFIATQTVNPSGRTQEILDASEIVRQLTDELRYAMYVNEQTATTIDFITDDRTGDGQPDRIRYEWSGTAGDPLTKALNDSGPQMVTPSVQNFSLDYLTDDIQQSFESPPVQSAEVLLDKYSGATEIRNFRIQTSDWVGQFINSSSFSELSLPGDTLSWSATRVQLRVSPTDSGNGEAWIRLRAATGGGLPGTQIFDEDVLYESTLASGYRWFDFNFAAETELLPSQNACLTIEHKANPYAAYVQYDEKNDDSRLVTNDGGATWYFAPYDDSLRYYLHGTYTQPSYTTETITRSYVRGVGVELQLGDVETTVSTETNSWNRPEVCLAYWDADFDSDPTAIDHNADSVGDWQMRDGGAFDVSRLTDGYWNATDEPLQTAPVADFVDPTILELRMRNTTVGGEGAVCTIHADWDGTKAGAMSVSLALQNDGTQTLRAFISTNTNARKEVAIFNGLPDDFVEVRMIVEPSSDAFAVWANDTFVGSYTYTPISAASDRRASIKRDGSDAQFERIVIKVVQ